jgi:non-canonical purine NTP pyrophosphatase (RdgB/HAM1 family)
MKKIIYLTTNPDKVFEMQRFLEGKVEIKIEIVKPSWPVIEIQASTCEEVAAFSAEYAADKLGQAVIKADAGFYVEALGGLPGPYSADFERQLGTEKFLALLKNEKNRRARIEQAFAYYDPGGKSKVFTGGSMGTIALHPTGKSSRFVDKFFIPNGETETISVIRDRDYVRANAFWGRGKEQLLRWLVKYA